MKNNFKIDDFYFKQKRSTTLRNKYSITTFTKSLVFFVVSSIDIILNTTGLVLVDYSSKTKYTLFSNSFKNINRIHVIFLGQTKIEKAEKKLKYFDFHLILDF